MQLHSVSVRALVARALLLGAGLCLSDAVSADIIILSNTVDTETEAIGGGGATPFQLGPVVISSNNVWSNAVNNNLDTGTQPATDAAQNVRGSARGVGIAVGNSDVDTASATISGDLQSAAQFVAAPDLGSGLGQSDVTVRIVFRVTSDTDYTLDASIAPVVGGLAGTDVFSVRRTSQIGNPVIHLINNAQTNDIVAANGTFLAGTEYTILADLSESVAGGSVQSPGDAQITAAFNLVFEAGTQIGLGGDLNGDGFVGIEDLNIVLGNWNQSVPPAEPQADPTSDGFVGIEDLNEVLGNWNQSIPPASLTAPEPAGALLLTAGAITCIHSRRYQRAR